MINLLRASVRRTTATRPRQPPPHLDGVHDSVGEDGHLASDGLHSLLELGHVRAGGEHAVQAGRPPCGRQTGCLWCEPNG